jgi:hypothetical protein
MVCKVAAAMITKLSLGPEVLYGDRLLKTTFIMMFVSGKWKMTTWCSCTTFWHDNHNEESP